MKYVLIFTMMLYSVLGEAQDSIAKFRVKKLKITTDNVLILKGTICINQELYTTGTDFSDLSNTFSSEVLPILTDEKEFSNLYFNNPKLFFKANNDTIYPIQYEAYIHPVEYYCDTMQCELLDDELSDVCSCVKINNTCSFNYISISEYDNPLYETEPMKVGRTKIDIKVKLMKEIELKSLEKMYILLTASRVDSNGKLQTVYVPIII